MSSKLQPSASVSCQQKSLLSPSHGQRHGEETQLVTFTLAGMEFAVPIEFVKEIVRSRTSPESRWSPRSSKAWPICAAASSRS